MHHTTRDKFREKTKTFRDLLKLQHLGTEVNLDLKNFCQLTINNKLVISEDKTLYMVYMHKNKRGKQINICIIIVKPVSGCI